MPYAPVVLLELPAASTRAVGYSFDCATWRIVESSDPSRVPFGAYAGASRVALQRDDLATLVGEQDELVRFVRMVPDSRLSRWLAVVLNVDGAELVVSPWCLEPLG